MDQNPLEQVQANKINTLKAELRVSFGHRFDGKEELGLQIEKLISELELWEKGGLVFDKEEIVKRVREASKIKDKEEFVNYMLDVLEPIIVLRINQAKLFSKIEREKTMNDEEHIKLSEVLYIGSQDLNNDNDDIYFHLSAAEDMMTKEKIADFKLELLKGLRKLAELIKPYPNLKKVWAYSWIIAIPRSRKRLEEEFGFIYDGMTSEEEAREHLPYGVRPMAKAYIDRENFLARYGTK